MTRLLSSRDTVQKNSPTANLGSMPCGCCATLPHRDGQGLGSPLHQRAALGGLVPPRRDSGGPRSPQDGARSAPLADPSPAGAVARSGGQGQFRTARDAMQWVKATFGVQYQLKGMYSLLKRLKGKKKVPRPLATNTSLEAQEEWKRGDWWLPSSRQGWRLWCGTERRVMGPR